MILELFLSSPTPISLTDVEEVVSNKVDVFVFISLEEVSHDELIFRGSPLATTFPILAATFESTGTFPALMRAEAPLRAYFLHPILMQPAFTGRLAETSHRRPFSRFDKVKNKKRAYECVKTNKMMY